MAAKMYFVDDQQERDGFESLDSTDSSGGLECMEFHWGRAALLLSHTASKV